MPREILIPLVIVGAFFGIVFGLGPIINDLLSRPRRRR